MNFEFSLEDLHFYIELEQCPKHHPDLKHSDFYEEDLDLWREGELVFFQMLITSSKINENQHDKDQRQHYVPAILLPLDNEEELQERIELFLDGPNGLEKILSHWDENTDTFPDWAHKD